MRDTLTLLDVVSRLAVFEGTIYAETPWTAQSRAIVAIAAGDELVPDAAKQQGLAYFLEVGVAREVLHGWRAGLRCAPSDGEACARLIRYAMDDA